MAQVMTVDEAARFLRIHPETLREKARKGEIPAAKVGREWRFSQEQVLAWIEHGGDIPQEFEDWAFMELVKERRARDDGRRIPWEEAKARLGL